MVQTLTIHLPGPLREVQIADPAHLEEAAPPKAAPPVRPADSDPLERERKALLQAVAALGEGARQFQQHREELVKEAEHQILELAVNIARKVVMQEIQAGRYEIDPIIQEALQRVPTRQEVVVRLNPSDLQKSQLASAPAPEGDNPGVRFVADPSVPPAHCLLETPQGIVESAVELHLDDIASALKNPE
jgi:flagellar assembly protein FliH